MSEHGDPGDRGAEGQPPAVIHPSGAGGAGGGWSVARLYAAYAAVFLGIALGIGTWLRAVFVWPTLKGPFTFQYLLHAHSHGAFFGWVTPALFAAIVAAARPDVALEARLRLHAHALGVLSAAAIVAFAFTGAARAVAGAVPGATGRGPAGAGAPTLAHGLGLTLMCGALVGLGWPALARALAAVGVGFAALFPVAFAGGAVSAVALLALLRAGGRWATPPGDGAATDAIDSAPALLEVP